MNLFLILPPAKRIAAWFLLAVSLLLQGCITTPFLKKGQYLLINQRVRGNKHVNTEDLEFLYQQRANRKILGFTPYLGFYFFGKSIWDTTRIRRQIVKKEAYYDQKISELPPGSSKDSLDLENKKERKTKRLYRNLYEGNWWMRVVGEPPAIYDSSLSRKTVKEIRAFMFNRGYFDNTVTLEEDTFLGGNIAVRYRISENEAHRIRRASYVTDDFRIRHLIDSSKNEALIRLGAPYIKENITLERERLERLLRNNGYYSFNREYVTILVDSQGLAPVSKSDSILYRENPALFSRFGCDVVFTIRNPESGRHVRFKIDSVTFTLNESDTLIKFKTDTVQMRGVRYFLQGKHRYSLGVLDSKVLLHPGQYFDNSRITNTQAQLSGMDMFRYVNLLLDTHQNNMSVRITANRLPKYQISDELGLLMSQGAPGPYVNVGFKVRNFLSGFEVFEVNTRYSQEGQISTFLPNDVVFRARDLSITSSLTFSEFLIPTRLRRRFFLYNPKTRFIFSLSSLKRPEYTRNLVKGALVYTLSPSQTKQIGISPIDVTVNVTPADKLSQAYLNQLITFSGLGGSIRQSFSTAMVTNFNAFFMFNNNQSGIKKKARYFRINLEYGGELIHQAQRYLNIEKDSLGVFKTFRYIRSQADFRYYRPYSRSGIVAFKLMGGAAIPIGASKVLPWEKYFFAGGSSSVRAWAPRRLGPGAYAPAGADPNRLTTEQPGELIVESSLEVRQKIVGFVEGAAFVDVGNVFRLTEDSTTKGSALSPLFIRQLALGGGLGLRFDFSFLIIRFDAATKIYNPAFTDEKDKWQIRNVSFKRPFGVKGQTLLNVGIGYPF